ncbi:hypothetical protein [Pleomorphomonas sp. JP5]|uniref:hypothetical protein n=1 Tax=Pleomorphomonas sp. JP5 TaxID=2942998 RepID=UPI002044778B|nr:hypothetical protein [Pleomorphomonas sp. JP5]MCM5558478.1 hypothetical protein [Pleomorphomonas sp. JP5]
MAQIGVGAVDPLNYVPFVDVLSGAAKGMKIARVASRSAALGAVQAGTGEAFLQATQPGRGWEEGAGNVASATILSGLLGAGLGYLTKGEIASLTQGMDQLRADATAHIAGAPMPQAAGAAASDARQLEQIPYLPKPLQNVSDRLSPTGRVWSSQSVQARRTLADLAETPRMFTDNEKGITTTGDGLPPLDRAVRQWTAPALAQADDVLKNAYVDYRYGPNAPKAPMLRAGWEQLRGTTPEGVMSPKEFNEAVFDALYSGDASPVPQVQQVAQHIRKTILEPVKKAAQETVGADGRALLGEVGAPAGDESFVPRLWNKIAVTRKRDEFIATTTDWLKKQQASKAEIQNRVASWQTHADDLDDRINKKQSAIETRERQIASVENRAEELTSLNQFAFRRSEDMTAKSDELRELSRQVSSQIQEPLQRLEALRREIGEAKERYPDIKEIDSLIFKLIGAGQKVKQGGGLIENIDALSSFADAVDEARSMLREGIREASRSAKRARIGLGADDLMALEKERDNINRAIAPLKKQLTKIRRQLRTEREAKIQSALGGAVFETRVRNRGNELQDRVSGKSAELDKLYEDLEALQELRSGARKQIEEELGKWQGKSTAEVKAALKARAKAEAERETAKADGTYQGRGERLTSADNAVERAVRRILASNRNLGEQELRDRANQIADRILSTPDGRLPYDEPTPHADGGIGGGEVRGSLNEREFAIPTAMVSQFLVREPTEVLHAFLRTTVPDILLTRRFGDVRMTEALKKVTEEYAAKAAQLKSEKARVKLEAEKQRVVRDLAAIRDRVRGVYGYSADPGIRKLASVARALRSWGLATDMGSSLISSLNDATGVVFRFGLEGAFRSAWRPFFKGLIADTKFNPTARRQAKAMGLALDAHHALNGRQLGDVIDYYKAGSGVEKLAGWAGDKSMIANGMAPFTDLMKTMASSAASDELLRMCQRVAAGKASKADVRDLAAANIAPDKAARIWQQHQASGVEPVDGVMLPETATWADAEARQSFEAAIAREADIAVVSPGQEKPLFLSRPVGALLGQFRGFTAAAHERVFIANLQRRDARTASGLVSTLAAGMLSYKLYAVATGQQTSDKPQDWVKEGVNRSGISGWVSDINAAQAKLFAGQTDFFRLIGSDRPLSRYAQRSALSSFLGPTYGRLERLQGPLYSLSQGTWTANDTDALRRWAWLQNHFALRRLFDKMEGR